MANNQTIMVSLRFNSDTTQAKKDIQGLIQEISKLSTNNLRQGFNHDLTQDIRNASNEVQKFSVMLRDAVNVDTGKLDLTKLNASLKASNTSLSQMANSFAVLGNQGVQSFANIVKQINAAEIPLKQTNKIVDKLWLSLKNTVNWQISSSAVHALVGGFESAFRYAEDLNESLNNIRIVTGYSADKMADFAKDANKAAKALSTTTVDYTDASLIYYQQGLTDEEVKQRTDVTIKMANATQESATIVSDQLTAIWNNFYDGSQSLEYYADVLTKLGAATASSTDEIAEGLEKFAAIGDTIGLSYEYATAALTTITSNTRQSADVVGTALKTIFARMQDLEQGETLDDGTTLGTYAQALEKVGISVLDTEGNLIEMDKILDAMGEKWETLSEAQQVALAQSVAGIRQYNQLVALMDNWNVDDADSMQANLKYIEESGGELQKQADIYAESWAAAQDRVAASAERIYSALIDEDFFIDLLDIGSDFLDLIANLIDGLGGVKGVLATISSYVLTIGKSQIIKELNRISMPSTKKKQQETIDTKINANQQLGRIAAQGTSEESKVLASTYSNISSLQIKMFNNADHLTEAQKNQVQAAIEQYEILGKISAEEAKSLDTIKQQIRLEQQRAMAQNEVRINQMQAVQGTGNPLNKTTGAWTQDEINAVNASLQAGGLNTLDQNQTTVLMRNSNALHGQAKTNANQAKLNLIQQLNDQLNQQAVYLRELPTLITRYKVEASKLADVSDILGGSTGSSTEQEVAAKVQAIFNTLDATTQQVFNNIQDDAGRTFNDIINSLSASTEAYKADATDILALNEILEQAQAQMAVPLLNRNVDDQFVANLNAEATATSHARREAQELSNAYKNIDESLDVVIPKQITWQEQLVNTAQILTSILSIYNSLNGVLDTWYDDEKSVGEKIETTFSSLLPQIGSLIFALNAFKNTFPATGEVAAAMSGKIVTSLGAVGTAIKGIGTALTTALPNLLIVAGAIGVIKLVINWINKAKQAKIDAAKETQETTTEEINKNKELVKSYQELYESYKETNEVSEDLQNTSKQLAEKLVKEGENVQDLANNYEELNERIDEYNAKQNAEQLYADQNSKWAYEAEFINAMREGKGYQLNGDYAISFNGAGPYESIIKSSNFAKNNSVKENINNSTLTFYTDANADAMYSMYEDAIELQKALKEAGATNTNTFYKSLTDWIDKSSEPYEALKELNEQIESESFQDAVNTININENDIRTFKDYESAYKNLNEEIQQRIALGEIEAENAQDLVEAYFLQSEELKKYVLQQQLANKLSKKFAPDLNESQKEELQSIINNLDEDSLQVAVSLVPETSSVEEFVLLLNKQVQESLTQAAIDSMIAIEQVIPDINSKNNFTEENYQNLQNNSGFNKQVVQDYGSFEAFSRQSINEQLQYVQDYYTEVSKYAVENLKIQQQMAEEELVITSNKYQAMKAISSAENGQELIDQIYLLQSQYNQAKTDEKKEQILQEWNNLAEEISKSAHINFDFQIDDDIDSLTELEQTLENIQEKISSINAKKIDIAVNWDNFDDIKDQMDSLGKFATVMQKDATKVGQSYEYPLDAVRDWMDIYPDLFKEATVTNDGLIALDQEKVDSYIALRQDEVKANADAKIIQWEQEKADLEITRDKILAEQEAIEDSANNQIKIEGLKDEQIATLVQQLTQYQIDCGVDEQEANKRALEAMGLNQEAYSDIVAGVSQKNAENMTDSAEEGSNNAKLSLESLGKSIKAIGHNIAEAFKAFLDPTYVPEYESVLNPSGVETTTFTGYTGENEFKTAAPEDAIESFKAQKFEQLDIDLTSINNAIDNLEAKIKGAQAIMEIDNAYEGTGGPDKNTADELKKVAERYHEITREIQRQEYELDQLAKKKDRAFGKDRLSIIDQEIEGYKNLKEQQEKLLDLAIGYLAIDAETVQQQFGGKAIINANTHEIDNWTELYDSATTEEQIEALEQYEETLDKMREQLETVQEIVYNIQDANYEKLEYELELKLDIDDSKIQELEFLLTQYGDNFYKRAEAAVAMMDKVPVYEDLLGTYEQHQEELNQKYAAGKISQADYIDGLKKIRDGYYEQLEALIALDEEMMIYYEDTLAAATSELEDYTDHMEHLTSVFEHYTNLMEILGKQKDYDAMGDFLGGKAETLRDRLDIAKQYYQILQDQRVEAEKALALANNDEERELLEKNLDAIIDEVDAAEDEVLSLTEEWAEVMKAVIENEMASIADTLEKALTNGLGFDNLMDSFDKLNTRQEEYLTKTNQIYETNKLMRTASKALDETDNKVAKQKLQNFIDETQSLQEQTQLSEYELEIQQAKYDLLLAEIALEEAQNAKSTVRLSRDNEGNFGYVYTADQDAIDDAQQELDDAKNSLYNLSLEGQQDYTDKYLQAQQEMYEALTELQQQYLDGEIASEEEYQRRTEEILYHYYNPDDGVLTTYSKLYNVAVRTDADATADYWAKDYGAMTQNTADWYEAVNEYLIQIEEQTNTWKEVSEAANEDVQGALDNSSEATERLTEESEALKEMLEDEVLDAIEDEIDAVREQTEAYAEQRQELQNLIATYKAYISALNSQIKSASSTSSGSSDYSYLMTEAYLNGDTDAYNTAAANRVDKLASGNYSSVDQDRLEGVFAAANNGNEKAQELIEKVYDKKLQYTDSTLKQYGFDTGGYTGEWGPEGKLAFLHQKELVLNQDDTENLLTAVSFIRELVNVIDSKASLASLFNLSSAGVANSSSALEQNVHIEASFPNATNHSEIEEAFENLVNKASQYANRK